MLLDINLPDATGWDVLRQLRAAGCDMPVVVISAVPPNPARVRENVDLMGQPIPADFWRELKASGVLPEQAPTPA